MRAAKMCCGACVRACVRACEDDTEERKKSELGLISVGGGEFMSRKQKFAAKVQLCRRKFGINRSTGA